MHYTSHTATAKSKELSVIFNGIFSPGKVWKDDDDDDDHVGENRFVCDFKLF